MYNKMLTNYRHRQGSGVLGYVAKEAGKALLKKAVNTAVNKTANAVLDRASTSKSVWNVNMAKPARYRRRRNRRLRLKGKKSIKKQLNEIKRTLNSDNAKHTRKVRLTSAVGCVQNQTDLTGFATTRTTELEGWMASLRYYNPSAPGTLVTADASTGTYTRQVHFKNVYKRMTAVNNYQVPVYVKIYSMVPKVDTSISPTQFFSDGITDQVISGGAVTNPLLELTDIDMVNENWRIVKLVKRLLKPGQSVSCYHSSGSFDYDPSNVDTHSMTYQKKYKAHLFVIRTDGFLGHDTSIATEQTTLMGRVDLICDEKIEILYDAGVNLDDLYIDNQADNTFTNSGVCSSYPVADNVPYSVS